MNRRLRDRLMRRSDRMMEDYARSGRRRNRSSRNDYGMGRYELRGTYDSMGDYGEFNDYRNPYGSRGGYVMSDRNFQQGDYRANNSEYGNRGDSHWGYPMGYGYPERYDYNYSDRGYMDRKSKEDEEEYHNDLKKWIKKLESKNRFNNVSKDQIIQHAKNMGVKFDEIEELEFYAIYLAMVTDYKSLGGDFTLYIRLAKDFFEDDDIEVSPSEKACIYMYNIVMGEE